MKLPAELKNENDRKVRKPSGYLLPDNRSAHFRKEKPQYDADQGAGGMER